MVEPTNQTALPEVLAEGVGFERFCRDAFVSFQGVLFGLTADEAPNVGVEGAELFLHFEESAGVADGGVDFQAVADDSGVAEQFANFLFVVARDFLRIEPVKHFAIPRALLQDPVPPQPRLRSFPYQELEPLVFVMHGHAPYLVVIGDVQLTLRPGTTWSGDLLVSRHGHCGFTPRKVFTFFPATRQATAAAK